MKRGTLKGISEIVRETCRLEGIETPLNEYRLIQAWSKVLGSGVQSYKKELFIKRKVKGICRMINAAFGLMFFL